ncbi:MAG: FixH family protein [Phycisphaerales bacterium]|nr:FixH family protein [Phycisphaerales bacterium]
MTPLPISPARDTSGSGKGWPAMIIGLLSLNVCIVAVTVVCATRDASFAIEPDYYQKAVEWDRSARERDRGVALGWGVSVERADPREGALLPVLRVRVSGSSATGGGGAPLDGAEVRCEVFAQARSGQRFNVVAMGVGGGVYEAEVPLTRGGVWEVRVRVKRGPDAMACVRSLLVPGAATEGGER